MGVLQIIWIVLSGIALLNALIRNEKEETLVYNIWQLLFGLLVSLVYFYFAGVFKVIGLWQIVIFSSLGIKLLIYTIRGLVNDWKIYFTTNFYKFALFLSVETFVLYKAGFFGGAV